MKVMKNMKAMKNMKRMMVGALMMAATATMMSCSMGGGNFSMNGDLKYSQQDLKPKAFKAIGVNVVADVYYTQNNGDKHDVKLDFSAIQNDRDRELLKEKVKVVYRDGGVEIGLTGNVKNMRGMAEGKRLKIYITSPDLVKVDMEGVGSFDGGDINSDQLELDNEGVGSMHFKSILANKIEITNEGVGSVTVDKVTGDDFSIDNEGVGKVNVGFFKGGKLDIDNEGVGKVSAKVDCLTVKASLEGVGGITLSGKTQFYKKEKDGVGRFSDDDLKYDKVLKVTDD